MAIEKKRHIRVFDTTLRDGEQAPGCSMTRTEKVRVARQLEALGVDVIEAGFPIASTGEQEAVKAVSDAVERVSVAALARANETDIRTAWEAIKDAAAPRIHTFIATSPIHMTHKLSMTPKEVLQRIRDAITYARSFCENVEFSAEDASRSEIPFLVEVTAAAIEAGAVVVNLPDTVGYATPQGYRHMFEEIRSQLPQAQRICLSAHCHNDLGLGTANSLAAIEGGAGQIEGTIMGIGERAGNVALEEVIMALKVRGDQYQADTGLDTRLLCETAALVSEVTGVGIPPNKAIIGHNAFAHEAGIHQDGVLKNAMTYEIMTPASVGALGNRLVLGKHSGRHAIREHIRSCGETLGDDEVEMVYRAVLGLADLQKNVTQADFRNIVNAVKSGKGETVKR